MPKFVIDEDLLRIYGERYNAVKQEVEQNKIARLLYWGDEIDLVDPAQNEDEGQETLDVQYYNPGIGKMQSGTVRKRRRKGKYQAIGLRSPAGGDGHLLEITFVDVQQGDATLIQLPDRRKILVDGGEGVFIARLLAAYFPGSTETEPLEIDTLIISHGDADHFTGLMEIPESINHVQEHKRLFLRINHCYHNGLVKAGSRLSASGRKVQPPIKESFGRFLQKDREVYAIDLWDDPRDATDKTPTFARWDTALTSMMRPASEGGEIRRLCFGDDAVFDRLGPDIKMEIIGPVEENIDGQPALRFFRDENSRRSKSHTINGHSVIFRMTYGNIRFLFGGDLNIDASEYLLSQLSAMDQPVDLESEILKVPHHGSHEFLPHLLDKIRPVVSVVSSGDDSVMKEYVHPRANLLAALGRYSRSDQPLVFSTELAAFFAYVGNVLPPVNTINKNGNFIRLLRSFHAFQRLIYGTIRVRTDGRRVLAAVESASSTIKEAYVFEVDALGNIRFEESPKMV